VTVTGFTLNGADAGNYNLVEPTALTANITPPTWLLLDLRRTTRSTTEPSREP